MSKSPLPVQNRRSVKEQQVCRNEALLKLLRWNFGHAHFKGKQLEAIEAVLSGRDCFCLMPTGGGKSICYQIPALAKNGIVLVVCPLIALMENQVSALKEKGIAAEFLSSAQSSQTRAKIHEDLESGKLPLRLLYVTPELIDTAGFMSKLKKIYARGLLNLIAIDEAHCVSTWGHDFRPSYRRLSSLRNKFTDVPILALTATAVPRVQKDVIDSLGLQSPVVLRSSFNRPNIYYEVRYKDLLNDVSADLLNVLKTGDGACAIIYCLERSTCDDLSTYISKNGISCAAYHAGLTNTLRSSVLDNWISSKIHVVVATVAFGMGIDRKDVRIVCHYNIPKSMEAFYQESGRAGRDQLPCRSLLYYGVDDRKRMEFIIKNSGRETSLSSTSDKDLSVQSLSKFHQMVEYCEGSICRRKKVLESFGELVSSTLCKNSCDACKHPSVLSKQLDHLIAVCLPCQSGKFPNVFISSNPTSTSEPSEFWSREDEEESGSGEDISDSDDDSEGAKAVISSKFIAKSKIHEKIELLEQAEESYYRNKPLEKQMYKSEKNSVTESQRDGCKKKILDALERARHRLGNLKVELETAASSLEGECFKKYGRSGKSFYYSQVASTVRWLSATSFEDLSSRLDMLGMSSSCKTIPSTPLSLPKGTAAEDVDVAAGAVYPGHEGGEGDSSPKMELLPQFPSFAEFVSSRDGSKSKKLRLC